MERNEVKEEELKFLAKEYKKNPELFPRDTLLDDSKFLEKFGIFIKDKENFPLGYLKLWPQDFIVEEFSSDGKYQTIIPENFFHLKNGFAKEDQTIYATLVKCNLSTIEAVEELASFLKIEKKKIQFAGIKDKNAITSQLVSLRNVNIDNLEKFNSPYIFLKNVYSGKGIVEIGSLKGNEFTIFVRTEKPLEEKLFLEKIKDIEKNGFNNFFYLQRFATPRLINFYWGLFVLKGEYEKAVLSFLSSPGLRESFYFQNLRSKIKENLGNWEKVEDLLKPFPLIFQNELLVARYLKKNPKDFIGALNQISQQVQLWLFAYDSWLFNKKLSSFLKKGELPPETMPSILSKDIKDWIFYENFLKENNIFSVPLKNLMPFPGIQWKKREFKTKEKAIIHQIKIIPGGVILNFTLQKGIYATTFLSHFFNLASGLVPEKISGFSVDIKATIGKDSLEETLNKFGEIIHPKTENIFEKFSQNE